MNDIVGKSQDNEKSLTIIKGIGDIGQAIQSIAQQLSKHEQRLSNVEDTMRVNGVQEKKLTDAVNRKIVTFLGGKESQAYQSHRIRSKAYSSINKDIRNKFGVPRRSEMPAKDYDASLSYIENWMPDYELKQEVMQVNYQLFLNIAN